MNKSTKPSLKIVHITSMHDWNDDRIYQRACVGLARMGHEVHLVAMKMKDSDQESFTQMGVTIHLVNKRAGVKRRWHTSKEVMRKAALLKAEVYQFHDPDLLPHMSYLLRLSPKPVIVYDIHENYAGRFQNWGLPAFLGRWFRSYEKRAINKISGYTVVSASMKELFKGVVPPVEITRNSTDIERLRDIQLPARNAAPETQVVITSGTHSHARNCLQTVQALPELKQLGYTPTFQFVGRYIQGIEHELQSQANADQTAEQLQLDGMAPWEENFQRIATAYCGCVFYADNPNNRVGIPNRLFEYMFCGIPVIVSNFPELKGVVEDAQCGVVVNSEDPKEIAKGLAALLKDPSAAAAMGKRGKEAMEHTYGYHVDLQRLEAFYLQLLP